MRLEEKLNLSFKKPNDEQHHGLNGWLFRTDVAHGLIQDGAKAMIQRMAAFWRA